MVRFAFYLALLAVGFFAAPAVAADPPIVIGIKDHQFDPNEVQVPAGEKITLTVRNQDTTAAEFESVEFHREKVVQPGGQVTLSVGPLAPGTYEFFDDFHPETRGHLVAK
jgi:plastocyanin